MADLHKLESVDDRHYEKEKLKCVIFNKKQKTLDGEQWKEI